MSDVGDRDLSFGVCRDVERVGVDVVLQNHTGTLGCEGVEVAVDSQADEAETETEGGSSVPLTVADVDDAVEVGMGLSEKVGIGRMGRELDVIESSGDGGACDVGAADRIICGCEWKADIGDCRGLELEFT